MRSSSKLFNLLAGLMAGFALLAFVLRLMAAKAAGEDPIATSSAAMVVLMVGVGIAGVLAGIGRLLSRPAIDDQPMHAALRDLQSKINELREMAKAEQKHRQSDPLSPTAAMVAVNHASSVPMDSEVAVHEANDPLAPLSWSDEEEAGDSSAGGTAHAGKNRPGKSAAKASDPDAPTLQSLADALDDLRMLYLMEPEQRVAYRKEMADRRRRLLLDQVDAALRTARMDRARDIMAMLQAQFAEDADVIAANDRLNATVSEAQSTQFSSVADQTEDLMAMGQFDQAMAIVQKHIDQHPSHEAGLALMQRVKEEKAQHDDQIIDRLFHEVKHHTDHRHWRKALATARKLIERYPEHRRTGKIREQLRVLQDNAQIEERKEIETRIQKLIHQHKYQEAIDLADQVIARFPGSPQAQMLITLLPKLRQTAIHAEMHLR